MKLLLRPISNRLLYACISKIKSITKMSIFTQKINPLTGTTEWELKDEHYDYYQEIARSAFADMLHDTERNQKYFYALKDAIEKMHNAGKKANVLDIGTGTGLLSMMAVKCGADSVVACEAFQPMYQCALKVIKDNHFEHDIKVIPKRSTDLTVGDAGDLKQRANILVSEVFDTELIGEGALGTFRHAHKELLDDECIVIPSSGTIYAQVVESSLGQSWNTLKSVVSRDGEILLQTPKEILECSGAAAVHDLQLNQLPNNSFNTILEPTPVLHFDWSGKEPLLFERTTITNLTAKRTGIAQLIFMWWDLKMDVDGKIILSCAPYWAHPDFKDLYEATPNVEFKQDLLPWRDHWMQAIYYLPQELTVQKNENLTLISCHDEYSLWFNLRKESKLTDADYLRPICECGFHVAYSRTRIGQLNDGKRNKKYLEMFERSIDSNTICLSINDGSIVSLASIRMGAKHLYCLERNKLLRKLLIDYVEFNNISDRVTIIDNLNDLKIVDLKQINLVFGEPSFLTSLVPWDNFQFKYILNQIKEHLPKDVTIIPSCASIKAVAVEFHDLHKIRAPLGDCEGFVMDKFDRMIQLASVLSDSAVEPQPLWEYPCKALSHVIELFHLNFNNDSRHFNASGEIELLGTGICNGIALWVDWYLDASKRVIISSGPISEIQLNRRIEWDMFTRQGVHLIYKAKNVSVNSKLEYNVDYDMETQNITFSFKTPKNKTQ